MTTHLRTQIRKAIQTTVTGLATAGANVFPRHPRPFTDAELPGTEVYSEDESSQNLNGVWGGPQRNQLRTMTVIVRHVDKLNTGLDDALDAMCLQCEQALIDRTLGGLSVDLRLVKTVISESPNGERLIGEALMTWEVDYTCIEGAPDTAH